MGIEELFQFKYGNFRFQGVTEYIDDLLTEEMSDRDFKSMEEKFVFLDMLENKIKNKVQERIGIYKVKIGYIEKEEGNYE